MKNLLAITVLASLLALPVLAATDDFIANGNITVSSVAGTGVTADMLIISGSKAESWTITGGVLTVTNPNSAGFMVGSSDTAVKAIEVNNASGVRLACAENSSAGASSVTLPSDTAVYTVLPTTTTDCESYCSTVTHAASYNAFPTCGAASCDSGYSLTGTGGNATCFAYMGNGGGGGGSSSTQTTTTTTENATPTPVTETPAAPTTEAPAAPLTGQKTFSVADMASDAAAISKSASNLDQLLSLSGKVKDEAAQSQSMEKYTNTIVKGTIANTEAKNAINNFIVYGTPSTKALGAGERAGVVSSFKSAFGKAPATEADWNDVIKIGNGRWPSQTDKKTEANAQAAFKKIYLREPNRKNPNDDAAVTVIAYGLRPALRNTSSEAAAIKSFKAIYGHNPASAVAWDIVRAIAYSGAKR